MIVLDVTRDPAWLQEGGLVRLLQATHLNVEEIAEIRIIVNASERWDLVSVHAWLKAKS